MSPANEERRPYGPGIDLVDAHGTCESIPAPPPPPSVFLTIYGVPPTEEELSAMAVRDLPTSPHISPYLPISRAHPRGALYVAGAQAVPRVHVVADDTYL